MSSKDVHNVQVSPSAGTKITPTHWFTTEIQQMMHGFGDCRKPLHESAVLLEEIVHSQMVSLLYQASEVATKRNGRFISLEDFLFLLRKDKVKLRRLLRYMELKDLKTSVLRGLDDEETAETAAEKQAQPPQKKRRKLCYDFIASFDQTGELLMLFEDDSVDEVKHERLMRAELLSRNMDPQQYREFCESRQVNFSRRYKSQRFKDWLMTGVSVDPKPNPLALEMFSYLAYETVAQLIDLALIVKRDAVGLSGDPLAKHMPSLCSSYYEAFQDSTISNTVAGSNTSTQMTGKGPGLVSPNQNGPATHFELHTFQAITPADIREALRRYNEVPGPFAGAVKRIAGVSPRNVLLCL